MPRTCVITAMSIAAALALTACGGSHNPTAGGQATASASRLHSDALKYSQCMRANGVSNFPDPGSGSGGGIAIQGSSTAGGGRSLTVNGVPVSAPAFQAAQQKCRKDLPQGPPVTASQVNKLRAGALATARCMRAHGVTNFPDPVVSAGPGGHGIQVRVGGAPGSGINPTSPAYRSAQQACGNLLGGRFGLKATKAATQVGSVKQAASGGGS